LNCTSNWHQNYLIKSYTLGVGRHIFMSFLPIIDFAVVIEEIEEDDKFAVRNAPTKSLETEDEDGFPVSFSETKKSFEMVSNKNGGKDKETSNEDRKRKSGAISDCGDSSGCFSHRNVNHMAQYRLTRCAGGHKKNKTKKAHNISRSGSEAELDLVSQIARNHSKHEVEMGKPDGKKATRLLLDRYIDKLKNDAIFDSNISGRSFEVRLGVGQVISGWAVGVNVKTGPSITDTAMGRIAQISKVISEGGYDKIFQQTFECSPDEKLNKAYVCYLSTSHGPIMGVLYLSTVKIAFGSDSPVKYVTEDNKTESSFYKVVLPLHHLRSVTPTASQQNPAERSSEGLPHTLTRSASVVGASMHAPTTRSTCSSTARPPSTPSSRSRSTTSTPSPPRAHHRLRIRRPPPMPARPRAYAYSTAFLGFVVAHRKEWNTLWAEVPTALKLCVDPNKFIMDVVTDVFPVDRHELELRMTSILTAVFSQLEQLDLATVETDVDEKVKDKVMLYVDMKVNGVHLKVLSQNLSVVFVTIT
ncbi:hypothetical protein ACJX0J_014408, partial [Zea mays]